MKSRVAELETETGQTAKEASDLVAAFQTNKEKTGIAERHGQLWADFLERDAQYIVRMRRKKELAAHFLSEHRRG